MNRILATDEVTKEVLPEFSMYFKRLLEPVDQWILTEIIDDWNESFKDEIHVDHYKLFKTTCKNFLQSKRTIRKYDFTWLENIIFISLQRYSNILEADGETVMWVRDFVEQNTNKAVDANDIVLRKVLDLYNKWSDEPAVKDIGFAQPYAFYLLFEVLVEDPILKKYVTLRPDNDPLKLFWATTQNGTTSINNRITSFAVEYFKNSESLIAPPDPSDDIFSTVHFQSIDLKKVNIDDIIDEVPEQRRIKITAMGIMGSGKSTIFKRIMHVLTNPGRNIGFERDNFSITQLNVVRDGDNQGESTNFFGPISRRTRASKLDTTELIGEIRINSKQYGTSVSDTRGGIMLDAPPKYEKSLENIKSDKYPLEKLLVNTDLLLVVMDPETIFYQDPDELFTFGNLLQLIVGRLDYLFHNSKHAMIAIVFTKFDEYGSVIKGPRNMINSMEQATLLKEYLQNGKDDSLNKLITAIGNTYLNKNRDTPLQQTVMLLLERVRYLLKEIVSSKQHPVINFYIASTAAMKDDSRSHWTGVADIFNDFSKYFDWLIRKKELVKIAPPSDVQTSMLNFQPVLDFLNSNDQNLLTIVERKENDGEFAEVDRNKTTYSNNRSSFVDKNVRYNTKYTYKIFFQDFNKDPNQSRASKEIVVIIPEKPAIKVSPPVDVTAQVRDGKAFLEWNNVNTTPTLVTLERKEQGTADYMVIFSNRRGIPTDGFADRDTEPGKTYFYRMKVCEESAPDNWSTYSNEVKILIPQRVILPPSSVKLALLNDKVKVSWKNDNKFPVLFSIERKTSGIGGWTKLGDNVRQESNPDGYYMDLDSELGKEYIYKIILSNIDREGSIQSEPVESGLIKTPPMGIEDLKWVLMPNNENPDCIELSWKEPQNSYNTHYKIIRNERQGKSGPGKVVELNPKFRGSQYKDTQIKRGYSYQYRIEVIDPSGASLSKPTSDSAIIEVPTSSVLAAVLVIIAISIVIILLILKLTGAFA